MSRSSRCAAPVLGVLLAVVLAPFTLGAVGPGAARPAQAAEPIDECDVVDATMEWGFKESFRAYIDGAIADGSWEVSEGASYATPLFSWANGTGVYDPATGTGEVAFTGTIAFTGHDGLLQTTVANPVIRLVDADTALLLLDVAGVSMEDAIAGDVSNPAVADGTPFVELELSGGVLSVSADGLTLTATDAPTTFTAEGYAAFPNYEVGSAFDPLSFTLTLPAGCEVRVADSSARIPVGVLIGGGALGVLIVAGVVVLVVVRRSRQHP